MVAGAGGGLARPAGTAGVSGLGGGGSALKLCWSAKYVSGARGPGERGSPGGVKRLDRGALPPGAAVRAAPAPYILRCRLHPEGVWGRCRSLSVASSTGRGVVLMMVADERDGGGGRAGASPWRWKGSL